MTAPNRIPKPRRRARLPKAPRDHRPLESRLLDVIARAGRPVTRTELTTAFALTDHALDAALRNLRGRGRITETPTGISWWQPTRDIRPTVPI